MTETIAIVGASGYIGRHLVASLALTGRLRIKILSRSPVHNADVGPWPPGVEVVFGDLLDIQSLHRLIEPECTVVNLVYLWTQGEQANLAAAHTLLEACRAKRIRRLIHCSTAAVSGRTPESNITETTECLPVTDYGLVKLRLEQEFLKASAGSFDVVVLRPTAVFGAGAEPLRKLAANLVHGSRFRNYLKSCLFGSRRMNLVYIDNVVAAFIFFIDYATPIGAEVFIVSDDEDPRNNFAHVEEQLSESLNLPRYTFPRVILPLFVLSTLLKFMGRNNINPRCNYAQNKLQGLGFRSPVAFEVALEAYTTWYRSDYQAMPGIPTDQC